MFIVDGSNIEFSFLALDALVAGLVVTMDNFVADSPHNVPLVPNASQELSRPKLSCLLFGADAFINQVVVLEI